MLIKVKVFPDSIEEEVIKTSEDAFEVRVKEKPERGLANRAVARALAAFLNVSPDKVRLVKGFRERNKIFEIKA